MKVDFAMLSHARERRGPYQLRSLCTTRQCRGTSRALKSRVYHQLLRFGNSPAGLPGPRQRAKWCQGLRLGTHLPHAPGARMTVVTQTPSKDSISTYTVSSSNIMVFAKCCFRRVPLAALSQAGILNSSLKSGSREVLLPNLSTVFFARPCQPPPPKEC